MSIEEQRRLTAYATVTRYPGEYEPNEYKDPKLGKLFYIVLQKSGKNRRR